MQYIAYAQRGEYEKCAEASFDCIACGMCSARCPAGITHPMVSLVARRLNGKYIAPRSEHVDNRVQEILNGDYDALIKELADKPEAELREMYDHREIEK